MSDLPPEMGWRDLLVVWLMLLVVLAALLAAFWGFALLLDWFWNDVVCEDWIVCQ